MQQEAILARPFSASKDMSRLPSSPPFILFMGNLSFDATEADVRAFFGAGVKSVKLITEQGTGRPKGFGYIEFVSVGDLQRALQLNGQNMKGRALKLDISEGRQHAPPPSATGEWRKGEVVGAKPVSTHPATLGDWRASAMSSQAPPATAKPAQMDWRARPMGQQAPPASSLRFEHPRQRSPRKQSFAIPLDIHKKEEAKGEDVDASSGRPALNLQPRSKPSDESQVKEGLATEYLTSNKPNPFGAANPKAIKDPTLSKQAYVDRPPQ
jgi:translation initiation factor 4B